MGGINEDHRNVAPPVICTRGRDTGDGRLLTGSLQEMDAGPDHNGSDAHGLMGRKASQSRRISQAKAQKQELVVCRDWQTGWLG